MSSASLLHVLALCFIGCFLSGANATCPKPPLNSKTYTLSEEKASYNVNETYEVFCIPGYTLMDGVQEVVCQTSNTWSGDTPTCLTSEGTYPWWLLLIAVLMIVIIVSCVLPRFLQCCLGKKDGSKGTGGRGGQNTNDGMDDYDDDSDDDRSESPVPDFTKNNKRMNNMAFMAKLYEHKELDKKSLKRATKNATF